MDDSMWATASGDLEAEQDSQRFARAKVEASTYWPFLAAAVDTEDFARRQALISAEFRGLLSRSIEAAHVEDLHARVTASQAADFDLVLAPRVAKAAAQRAIKAAVKTAKASGPMDRSAMFTAFLELPAFRTMETSEGSRVLDNAMTLWADSPETNMFKWVQDNGDSLLMTKNASRTEGKQSAPFGKTATGSNKGKSFSRTAAGDHDDGYNSYVSKDYPDARFDSASEGWQKGYSDAFAVDNLDKRGLPGDKEEADRLRSMRSQSRKTALDARDIIEAEGDVAQYEDAVAHGYDGPTNNLPNPDLRGLGSRATSAYTVDMHAADPFDADSAATWLLRKDGEPVTAFNSYEDAVSKADELNEHHGASPDLRGLGSRKTSAEDGIAEWRARGSWCDLKRPDGAACTRLIGHELPEYGGNKYHLMQDGAEHDDAEISRMFNGPEYKKTMDSFSSKTVARKTAGHEISVTKAPACDVCRQQGSDTPATHDSRLPGLGGTWGNVCQRHFDAFGPGQTGTGHAQKFKVTGSRRTAYDDNGVRGYCRRCGSSGEDTGLADGWSGCKNCGWSPDPDRRSTTSSQRTAALSDDDFDKITSHSVGVKRLTRDQVSSMLEAPSGSRPRIYGYWQDQIISLQSQQKLDKYDGAEAYWTTSTGIGDLVSRASRTANQGLAIAVLMEHSRGFRTASVNDRTLTTEAMLGDYQASGERDLYAFGSHWAAARFPVAQKTAAGLHRQDNIPLPWGRLSDGAWKADIGQIHGTDPWQQTLIVEKGYDGQYYCLFENSLHPSWNSSSSWPDEASAKAAAERLASDWDVRMVAASRTAAPVKSNPYSFNGPGNPGVMPVDPGKGHPTSMPGEAMPVSPPTNAAGGPAMGDGDNDMMPKKNAPMGTAMSSWRQPPPETAAMAQVRAKVHEVVGSLVSDQGMDPASAKAVAKHTILSFPAMVSGLSREMVTASLGQI